MTPAGRIWQDSNLPAEAQLTATGGNSVLLYRDVPLSPQFTIQLVQNLSGDPDVPSLATPTSAES